jgi:hypothetical protein
MALSPYEKRSQLFTLRVWPEEVTAGNTEWRGKIQRVVGGETVYFHSWDAMLTFLLKSLDATGETQADTQAEAKETLR